MPSLPSLPHYEVWITDPDTALLVIDSGVSPEDQQSPHTHINFGRSSFGSSLRLGSSPGATCAIFKVVIPQTIHFSSWQRGIALHDAYEILPGLELKSVNPQNISSLKNIRSPDELRGSPSCRPVITKEDLENLFSMEWPEWLRPALTSQLCEWQIRNKALFYRYSPWPMSRDDMWSCVKCSPYEALRRFGSALTETQRRACLVKEPRAAACYALQYLGSRTRRNAILKFPEEVLKHASEHLTDAERSGILEMIKPIPKLDLLTIIARSHRLDLSHDAEEN